MTCYHPITVFLPSTKDIDGKRRLIFSPDIVNEFGVIDSTPVVRSRRDPDFIEGFKIKVPCGKCIGCRLDYSRDWAVRAVHESKLYKDNTFVTLTFDDEHLPDDKSLNKGYMSSWMKRFRKQFGNDIRFMMCGEYGEKFKRPHYHILFFNFKFPDQKYWSNRHGQIYYRSSMLEDVWRDACGDTGNGYSVIGNVTFESAAYVGRYVTKKLDGDLADYGSREKEFLNCSRMPGLGHDFIMKNYEHIFNNNYIVLPNGKKCKIPRYYKSVVEKEFPEFFDNYYKSHQQEIIDNLFMEDVNCTQERLLAREELKKYNLDKLIRCYEFDPNLHNIYSN